MNSFVGESGSLKAVKKLLNEARDIQGVSLPLIAFPVARVDERPRKKLLINSIESKKGTPIEHSIAYSRVVENKNTRESLPLGRLPIPSLTEHRIAASARPPRKEGWNVRNRSAGDPRSQTVR